MSAEDQVPEKEADPTPLEPPKATPAKEALTKLEDHRCAICQNILINACRIDCGHTFCRHCLNVDKDDRIGSEKPTCFICDAAITEISNNPDRDKDIEKLFLVLPTDEKLSRERTKSERKEEEANFANRPKNEKVRDTDRNSNGSAGSGDGIYNMPDNLEGACWRDYGNNFNSNDNEEENLSENDSPIYFCRSYPVWSEELGSEECHHVHEAYEEGENSSSEEGVAENSGYANSPFPQPIVIHHTVQHIYHTVDPGDRTGSESTRRNEVIPTARGPEHAYPTRYRNYGSPRRPISYQGYNFPNHYRNPGPTYASAGYCSQHYNGCTSTICHTSPYSAHAAHAYYSNHQTYPQMTTTMYTTGREYPPEVYECDGHDHGSDEEDNENDGLEDCCACESLCEFHQAMRDGDESPILYTESRSPENLSPLNSSHNRIVFDSEVENASENMEFYEEHNHEDRDEQELFTFNVTIPMSVAENLALRRESYERRVSSRNSGDSNKANTRRKR